MHVNRLFLSCIAALCGTLCSLPVVAALPDRPPSSYASAESAPVVAFDGRILRITSVTPGATVVIFGITRDALPYEVGASNLIAAPHADASGSVALRLPADLGTSTVIAVVDVDSGRYALASPGDEPLRLVTFPISALRKKDAEFELLDLETGWLEAVCVRPRKGAWYMFVVDGAGHDLDRQSDGKTLISAAQMRRLYGDDDSPKKFRPHDVLVVIDPRTMQVMATEVPK